MVWRRCVMKIRLIVAALATIMLFPVFSTAGDVVLIGNSSIRQSTVSKQDIMLIFLGTKNAWADGSKIVFAIQKNKKLNRLFLKKYVGKSPSQYANHLRKLVFTGKRSSPRICDGNQEMIKFVSETKGAIGYVSTESALTGSALNEVKTINVK